VEVSTYSDNKHRFLITLDDHDHLCERSDEYRRQSFLTTPSDCQIGCRYLRFTKVETEAAFLQRFPLNKGSDRSNRICSARIGYRKLDLVEIRFMQKTKVWLWLLYP
jgi:hypothetical protein